MNKYISPDILMQKAERALQSSKTLIDDGDSDGACNRAYYAMFDAARAALSAIGEDDPGRTHKGVIISFNLHFVKTERCPADMGRLLKQAETLRYTADYTGLELSVDDVDQMILNAETFISFVRENLVPVIDPRNDGPGPL